MAELANCSRCGDVFAKSIRNVCSSCYHIEEEAFQTVYAFLSKQENREATMMEVVEATDVEEEIISKFIKERRLRISDFPKLAYPCERCGVDIVRGRVCAACSKEWQNALGHHEDMLNRGTDRNHAREQIYFTIDKNK